MVSAQGKPSGSNFLSPCWALESSREIYKLEMTKTTSQNLDYSPKRSKVGHRKCYYPLTSIERGQGVERIMIGSNSWASESPGRKSKMSILTPWPARLSRSWVGPGNPCLSKAASYADYREQRSGNTA